MIHKILSINDNLHGLIEISELEKQIISNNLFNRLHDVYQDSTVYLTFPTDRTKRFEHSIGAMYLVGEMFSHALSNAEGKAYEMFIQDVNKSMGDIVNDLFQKRGSPQNISNNLKNIFNIEQKWDEVVKLGLKEGSPIDGNIAERILSAITKADAQGTEDNKMAAQGIAQKTNEGVVNLAIIYQAVRIAALLHDVGHLPFSHITEHAIGELYAKYKKDKNNPLVKAYDTCKKDSIHTQLHEMIGDKIVNLIFEEVVEKLYLQQSNDKRNESQRIYFCIIWICVMLILTNGRFNERYYDPKQNQMFWTTLHSLIDGEIDCDRLDYIVRDGKACGIVGTQVDYKRIISGLKLCVKREKRANHFVDTYCFAFLAKSLNSIENFYLKRYNLYQNAIYHHRVIKTDTLLQKIIVELASEYFDSNKGEEQRDREMDVSLFPTDNIRGLWMALKCINSKHVDSISNLIQWNDSWLITVLKNEWYTRKANEQSREMTEALTDKLDEILTNEKYYFSAVKREYDFALIDDKFRDVIEKNLSCFCKIESLLAKKQPISFERLDQLSPLEQLHQFKFVLQNGQWSFLHTQHKFFALNLFENLVWKNISGEICNDRSTSVVLEDMISECAVHAKEEFNKEENVIADVIIGMKKNKGINAARVNLYRPFYSSDKQEQMLSLDNTSNIQNAIDLFRLYSPLFYVYIKKTRNAPEQIDANKYLQILGTKLGECIVKCITKLGDKVEKKSHQRKK